MPRSKSKGMEQSVAIALLAAPSVRLLPNHGEVASKNRLREKRIKLAERLQNSHKMKAKTALQRSTAPTGTSETEAQIGIISYFAKKISSDLKAFFQTSDAMQQHAKETSEWIEAFKEKNAR